MKKKLALALSLLLALSTLAGCGSSDNKVAEPAPEDREMRVGLTQVAANLDQQTSQSEIDTQYYAQIYDTLIKKDAEGNFVGALAESWTISEDKLTIQIKLREEVKFSNGEELKASDVAFTVNRGQEYSGTAQYFAKAIDRVEVIDDYNLVIHIKEPNATIMDILTAIFIMNEKATTEAGDQYGLSKEFVVGCGPYMRSTYIWPTSRELPWMI